jgi:hypothetical protein
MKKIGLMLAALLVLAQPAYAMLPLTEKNVQAAQLYGAQRKGISTKKLVAPWTVYDRKKTNKYGVGENAVIYTPYLMAAIDAHVSAKKGTQSTLERGMKVAKDYDGVLAVGITISTTTKLEPKFLKIKMYQGTNVVEPYYTILNSATRRKMKVNSAAAGGVITVNVWDDQYYTYFDLKKLNPKRVMVLAVTDDVGGTREFVLNLNKVN